MSVDLSHSETKTLTWNWLKSISRALYSMDETPLLGNPPPFPWEMLSQQFAKSFGITECTISATDPTWKEAETALSGMSGELLCVQLSAVGAEGPLSFWISQNDVQMIMGKVLKLSPAVLMEQKPDMFDAFYQFLNVQTLAIVNQIDFDKKVSFKILSHDKATIVPSLCMDITVSIDSEKILTKLVVSNEFRKSWATLFSKPHPKTTPAVSLENLPLTIHVEAGRTNLSLNELLQIHQGDFVLLDHVFFAPDDEKKNRLILSHEGKPLFRAKLKSGSLKILEIPLHHEVYDSMVDNVSPPSPAEEENKLPPQHSEEDPFADEDEDDIASMDTEAPMQEAPEGKKTTAAAEASFLPTKPLTANDVPLSLVVELAQVTISAQKLLELQPGNLIDLEIEPESGVNLVVNGKLIGRGEILKIGEAIGVRVLQIGT